MTIAEARTKLDQAVEHLVSELKKLRTGRAAASMLDNVTVEVYGQQTPLPHIASITAVDATLLQVSPYDPNNLDAISAAIREDQALGLNPADDGRVVRLQIPAMTSERRQEVVKQLHEKVEETNISFRNIRHDILKDAKQDLKDKNITEDDLDLINKEVTELLDEYNQKIATMTDAKESEILTV